MYSPTSPVMSIRLLVMIDSLLGRGRSRIRCGVA